MILLFPLPVFSVWFAWLLRQWPVWLSVFLGPSSMGQMADAGSEPPVQTMSLPQASTHEAGCCQRGQLPTCFVLDPVHRGKGCLPGACWHGGEFLHTLGRFGEQSSPHGQVQPVGFLLWDYSAVLRTGTPCHSDPHLCGLTHYFGHSSTRSLSMQCTPSPLLSPSLALPWKHPPSFPCQEQGPLLARPMWGL